MQVGKTIRSQSTKGQPTEICIFNCNNAKKKYETYRMHEKSAGFELFPKIISLKTFVDIQVTFVRALESYFCIFQEKF